MRFPKILWLVALLILMQSIISAQGMEPAAPWPPDPDAIFEAGVQWRQVTLNSTAEPYATIDQTQRAIQVQDGSGHITREYDFPSDKNGLHRAHLLPDGTIQVVVDWIEGWSYQAIDYSFVPGNVLMLDPETELYSVAPTVCDNLAVQTQQGSPLWKAVGFHTEPKQWMVCETETGILLDILPDRFDWWTVLQPRDANWLILAGYDEDSHGGFQLFSYDLEDKIFRILGEMRSNADDRVNMCDMLSNTVGLLCVISNHHYISTAYYSFDLTQSFSIDFAFSGWPDNAFEVDQPPRNGSVFSSEYFSLISGSGIATPFCSMATFDLEGDHFTPLGSHCLLNIDNLALNYRFSPYYQKDHLLYLLTTEAPDAATAYLRSYDIKTDVIEPVLQSDGTALNGEFETILSVSPDNRYIVLLTDDDGKFNFPVNSIYSFTDSNQWPVTIFDRDKGDFVYVTEPLRVYASRQVIWLDDTTVVLSALSTSDSDEGLGQPASLHRIKLHPDGSIETHVTTEYDVGQLVNSELDHDSLQLDCYLLHPDDSVINLHTFERIRLIREAATEDYYFEMNRTKTGALGFIVYASDGKRTAFEINLPDCAAPQP